MASKSKRQRAKKEGAISLVLISLTVGILALLQRWYGEFSDIRFFMECIFMMGKICGHFLKKY